MHDVPGEGRCTVVDTWWQTETGGIMLTPKPSGPRTRPKPGFPMLPFFGVDPAILDANVSNLSGGGACVVS